MTKNPLKVSIVITCYNYARYVGLAIESSLAQTYPYVEIVVIDDGSTDGSDAVIRQYEGRIRSIRQTNQGFIAAFNRGYREATGDLVLFLDADDLASSMAVAECVAAWSAGCAKIQYDLDVIDATGFSLGRKFCNFTPEYDSAWVRDCFARTGTYRWPVTSGNLYSRAFLDAMMPLNVAHAPDGLLNTVAPIYGEVITVPKSLGCYRVHGANAWSSNGKDLTRLPERIDLRLTEFDALKAHASKQGVQLAPGNLLDHELTFINYRLMSLRLEQTYRGSGTDTPASLWRLGMAFLRAERMPLRIKLAHAVWLTAMRIAPGSLAKSLITLRFNRASYVQPVRRAIQRFFGILGYRRHGA